MWNFLQRRRLIGKGMACGKTRRTVGDTKFTEALECAWPIRFLILGGFVGGLAALIFTGQQEEPAEISSLSAQFRSPRSLSFGSNIPEDTRRQFPLSP